MVKIYKTNILWCLTNSSQGLTSHIVIKVSELKINVQYLQKHITRGYINSTNAIQNVTTLSAKNYEKVQYTFKTSHMTVAPSIK